jgi:hypothetical protein
MSKVLEFADSSAISKISLDPIKGEVGVAFTYKPDLFYLFECEDVDDFENSVNEVVSANDSIGKFVSLSRKDGTLTAI